MGKFGSRKCTSEIKQQASEFAQEIGPRKAAEQLGLALQIAFLAFLASLA